MAPAATARAGPRFSRSRWAGAARIPGICHSASRAEGSRVPAGAQSRRLRPEVMRAAGRPDCRCHGTPGRFIHRCHAFPAHSWSLCKRDTGRGPSGYGILPVPFMTPTTRLTSQYRYLLRAGDGAALVRMHGGHALDPYGLACPAASGSTRQQPAGPDAVCVAADPPAAVTGPPITVTRSRSTRVIKL